MQEPPSEHAASLEKQIAELRGELRSLEAQIIVLRRELRSVGDAEHKECEGEIGQRNAEELLRLIRKVLELEQKTQP